MSTGLIVRHRFNFELSNVINIVFSSCTFELRHISDVAFLSWWVRNRAPQG